MKTLAVATAILIGAGAPALAEADLVGTWAGTFEFITLGKKGSLGPAAVFEGRMQAGKDEWAKTGQGHASLTVAEQIGRHFYGEWSIDAKTARFTCTMTTQTHFICGGTLSEASGFLPSADTMRLCWRRSGDDAATGCADLERTN